MASNPLDHVVQHPLKEVPADAGVLTPNGVITVLSDHIAMIILSGLLLCLFLPWAMRRRQTEGIEGMVATGFANFIEVVCEFLRKQVAEALHIPASKVSRSLALLDLPPEVQARVSSGQLAARTTAPRCACRRTPG